METRGLWLVVVCAGCATGTGAARPETGASAPIARATAADAGVAAADAGVPEGDEADLYLRDIASAHPSPAAFRQLARVFPTLSAERREAISRTGSTPEAPVHVLDIRGEYQWVNTFGCPGERPKIVGQAMVGGKNGPLDVLRFLCRGAEREIYFDYSDDPVEKAMRRELEEPKPGPPED